MTSRNFDTGEVEDMGKLCVSVEILPKGTANDKPAVCRAQNTNNTAASTRKSQVEHVLEPLLRV